MTSRRMFEMFFAPQYDLDLTIKRDDDVGYLDPKTRLAWEAWRQSAQYYHLDGEG